jgi:hypothetical protein
VERARDAEHGAAAATQLISTTVDLGGYAQT